MRPETTSRESESTATVRVEHSSDGHWEIELPDRHESVICETFGDAQRIAYLCAAYAGPCELIVQDAYHRVVEHRLINEPPACR